MAVLLFTSLDSEISLNLVYHRGSRASKGIIMTSRIGEQHLSEAETFRPSGSSSYRQQEDVDEALRSGTAVVPEDVLQEHTS